ncbi:MAG TPA: hypothetical protein VEG68_18410 [Terriglobales bacterium]|nr:hypothetical protein [Terriglobales bacterium]
MPRIRVLVANQPRLMRELVLATIANQPDIELIGEAPNEAEVSEAVDRTRPDCLIITLEKPQIQPILCGFLLGQYPQMKVLAVAPEGDASVFYWSFTTLRSKTIEVSTQGVLGALRDEHD